MSRVAIILGSTAKPQGIPVSGQAGEYVRKVTNFHDVITCDGSTEFPAVSGRYHLYVSAACPWSHRTMLARKLKGLEDHISISHVDTLLTKEGWRFTQDRPDPLHPDVTLLRQLYGYSVEGSTSSSENSSWTPQATFTGRVTVPVLWDKVSNRIVNNESSEIIRMFNFEFNELSKYPNLDLYPEKLRTKIDEVNKWVYEGINDGVYRAGFAETQAAYDFAIEKLSTALDRAEDHLSTRRYLVGKQITEADIRLFVTLVRYDAVYAVHFKCSHKRLNDYPNLFNYTKELYQMPLIKEDVLFDDIRKHYYQSHVTLNPRGIVAAYINRLDEPHNRIEIQFPDD